MKDFSMPEPPIATARDFLAVERTFLAWIRTGLALMGLGFVLARFGIFLREFSIHQPGLQDQSFGLSIWFGTGLIFLGVLVAFLSLFRYRRMLRNVEQAQHLLAAPSRLAMGVAVILAILGLAMVIYLISVRPVAPDNASKPRETSMTTTTENGIMRVASNHSVDETVGKLQSILQAKGVKLFGVVDHSGEAAAVGLKMPNTKLVIFGNPKAGTPLMLASPSTALDLPLKILVAEDAAGKVWVSYNAPAFLQSRHSLPADLLPNIAVIETLAAKAAE
jgi:uncharacterized protein (DUF302 family)/uncharacterized membrane protein YidH (DUF202 family)